MKPISYALRERLARATLPTPSPRRRVAVEAGLDLARLLDRMTASAAPLTLTRRGLPVAHLVPAGGGTRPPGKLLHAFRASAPTLAPATASRGAGP